MTAVLRKPGGGDLPGLFECLATYRFHVLGDGPLADPDFGPDALLQVRNTISHVDLEEKCWVAEDGGRILGFCNWAWLDEGSRAAKTVLITVRPEARGTGVGALLQQRRMDEMVEAGAREVHTWSDDPKAIAWYQARFGYEALGEEPIRHCLHRFTFRGETVWGLHRGFPEQDRLVHLRRRL